MPKPPRTVSGVRYTYSMNNNKNRKASRNLTFGDFIIKDGEKAMFLHYTGYPRSTRYGVYRTAFVQTPDGENVQWSFNQAGSVEIFGV